MPSPCFSCFIFNEYSFDFSFPDILSVQTFSPKCSAPRIPSRAYTQMRIGWPSLGESPQFVAKLGTLGPPIPAGATPVAKGPLRRLRPFTTLTFGSGRVGWAGLLGDSPKIGLARPRNFGGSRLRGTAEEAGTWSVRSLGRVSPPLDSRPPVLFSKAVPNPQSWGGGVRRPHSPRSARAPGSRYARLSEMLK